MNGVKWHRASGPPALGRVDRLAGRCDAMGIRGRMLGPALLAGAILLGAAGVVHAGDTPGGEITFRLVLRGDVIEGDNFSLGVNELTYPADIISPGIRCGPGSEVYNPQFVACEPGSFDFVIPSTTSLPIGTNMEYGWARNYGAEANRQADLLYTDTITVTENAQVFTVVYDYGGVPDTAMSRPAPGIPLAIVVVTGAVLVTLAYASRRSLRPRRS
jgi:hypothetical protein